VERALGRHSLYSCVHHPSNLRALCAGCHREVTAGQRAQDLVFERAIQAFMSAALASSVNARARQ
jgi:hypothetical protein